MIACIKIIATVKCFAVLPAEGSVVGLLPSRGRIRRSETPPGGQKLIRHPRERRALHSSSSGPWDALRGGGANNRATFLSEQTTLRVVCGRAGPQS